MAQLAIKGHATRGSEVIEILEMLGGEDGYKFLGNNEECAYFEKNGVIYNTSPIGFNNIKLFTLEEFLDKFPYKVGYKVTHNMGIMMQITNMYWDAECNVIRYDIQSPVDNNYKLKAMLAEHLQPYKEETMDRKFNVEEYLKVWEETEKGLEVVVNDNFELKEDSGKFYIIKKQPRYPKTYKECCEVIDCNILGTTIIGYKTNVLRAFQKLLICRDAYWKIAGEQMGLGKPWEQNYCDRCFIIANNKGDIHRYEYHGDNNVIFAFPTREMRDAFYENFKDLIEQCKELL